MEERSRIHYAVPFVSHWQRMTYKYNKKLEETLFSSRKRCLDSLRSLDMTIAALGMTVYGKPYWARSPFSIR